jgi:hypothetical protein
VRSELEEAHPDLNIILSYDHESRNSTKTIISISMMKAGFSHLVYAIPSSALR